LNWILQSGCGICIHCSNEKQWQSNERILIEFISQAFSQSFAFFFRFDGGHEIELVSLIAGDQVHGAAFVGILAGENAANKEWLIGIRVENGIYLRKNSHFVLRLIDPAIAAAFFVPAWSQVHFAILHLRVFAKPDFMFFLSISDCPEEQKQQGKEQKTTAASDSTLLFKG
jgi:hypothetical protein